MAHSQLQTVNNATDVDLFGVHRVKQIVNESGIVVLEVMHGAAHARVAFAES